MRDHVKYYPVNWINGMKINKDHFIAQDNACTDALQDIAAFGLSPLRYGVLTPSVSGQDTFNIKTTLDNQNTLRVTALACDAITPGGARITLPSVQTTGLADNKSVPDISFQFQTTETDDFWWIILTINPFDKKPFGSPDLQDNPPRFPHVLPSYNIQVINDSSLPQFIRHPYALIVGKIVIQGKVVKVDQSFIPACYSVSSQPALVAFYSVIDEFLGTLEVNCCKVVQKIFSKNQQNEISELVQFICDRIILFLATEITQLRWKVLYEPPSSLFTIVVSLARLMKNAIDLRSGSGKEVLMNYLIDWCDLKQGELENLLLSMANLKYKHYDINRSIEKTTVFINVTTRLFETLSRLEFIGKKKESGIFVKEEPVKSVDTQPKTRRSFFG